MATIAGRFFERDRRSDILSGTPRAHAIDRWIYVFTAASFIVIVLAGFIPDSLGKIAAVQAAERPAFPLVLHVHAVLMGSFLLLLLAQTVLVAIGRTDLHRRLGLAGIVLAPALVIAGFVLVPTNYHLLWNAAQSPVPQVREKFLGAVHVWENIMLLQIRIGILFPLFLSIGLTARGKDAGLHKRMMILATAMALPAGIDRIPWLWSTMPANPISADLFTLIAVSPMFIWDVVRNRSIHRAYLIWLGVFIPTSILVQILWNTPFWHTTARQIMGV